MNNDYLTELKDELEIKENKLHELNYILDKLSIAEYEELYIEENDFIKDNRVEPVQYDENDISYILKNIFMKY